MTSLLRLTLILVFFTLFKNTLSLSRPRLSCPSKQPKCCNLVSKFPVYPNKYPKHVRKYDIHPKGHLIKLVNGCYSRHCPISCPKQLGEPCGGYCHEFSRMITHHGYCDSQWLTCKYSNDYGWGTCIRKHNNGIEKTKAIKDAVPVCDDLEKVNSTENSSRRFSYNNLSQRGQYI